MKITSDYDDYVYSFDSFTFYLKINSINGELMRFLSKKGAKNNFLVIVNNCIQIFENYFINWDESFYFDEIKIASTLQQKVYIENEQDQNHPDHYFLRVIFKHQYDIHQSIIFEYVNDKKIINTREILTTIYNELVTEKITVMDELKKLIGK